MYTLASIIAVCALLQPALSDNLVEVLGPGGLIGGNTAHNPTGAASNVPGAASGLTTGGSNVSVISVGKNPTGGNSVIAILPNSTNGGISVINAGIGKDATNTSSIGSGVHLSALDIGGGGLPIPGGATNGTATAKLPDPTSALVTKPNANGPSVKLGSCCNVNPKNWKASDAVVTFHNGGMPQAQLDYILAAAADATNAQSSPYDRCSVLQQNLTSKYPRKSNENGWYCVSGCGSMNQHGSYGWFLDDATFWFGDIKIEIFRPQPYK